MRTIDTSPLSFQATDELRRWEEEMAGISCQIKKHGDLGCVAPGWSCGTVSEPNEVSGDAVKARTAHVAPRLNRIHPPQKRVCPDPRSAHHHDDPRLPGTRAHGNIGWRGESHVPCCLRGQRRRYGTRGRPRGRGVLPGAEGRQDQWIRLQVIQHGGGARALDVASQRETRPLGGVSSLSLLPPTELGTGTMRRGNSGDWSSRRKKRCDSRRR